MTENEFLLQDRIAKIKSVVEKYGEDNFYVSFSGGKDSTVLSALIDMALPGNKIPRVYANTGIEYQMIVEFVEREREKEHPWELHIIKPSVPIKPMLEQKGYPFKSKKHAKNVNIFQNHGITQSIQTYLGMAPTKNKQELEPLSFQCPKSLRFQFTEQNKLKISDRCCVELKEKPLKKWSKENNKPFAIIGILADEGGRRMKAKCLAFESNKFKAFQPLVPLRKEWEEWFIEEYHVDICQIYKPPYNFPRTGCKGCPFAIGLQKELDTLEKFFPAERKQCEYIWAPVYAEYRRLGYRLKEKKQKKWHQMTVEEFLKGE